MRTSSCPSKLSDNQHSPLLLDWTYAARGERSTDVSGSWRVWLERAQRHACLQTQAHNIRLFLFEHDTRLCVTVYQVTAGPSYT